MTLHFFLKKFDWVLLGIVSLLIALSVATFYHLGPSAPNIIQRQLTFFSVGIAVMAVVSLFDYRIFKNYSIASLIPYLITLILLLITLTAETIRGVSSWLYIGNYGLEPSELAKLAIIILLAKYFSQKHVNIYDIKYIVASGFYVALPAFLILIQPDLGSAAIFVVIWVGLLLSSGVKKQHFLYIMLIGAVIVSIGWFGFLKPYQKTRITTFLDPYLDPKGEGYSIIQSQITVGSGQFWGSVLDKDPDKYPVLVPEPYTDFTFAMFAQKFGFWGIGLLFSLIFLIVYRMSNIANLASNNFAKLFTLGFSILIVSHVAVNAGMNIGLLPITGLPFSFLSYGGSHMMTLMIGLGVVQSIKLHT